MNWLIVLWTYIVVGYITAWFHIGSPSQYYYTHEDNKIWKLAFYLWPVYWIRYAWKAVKSHMIDLE